MKHLPLSVSIVDTNEAGGLQPGLQLKIPYLDRLKRGDFIRVMVKYQEGAAKSREILTCLVTATRPGSGLVDCKIFSSPELTHFHTLEYGDDLTIQERSIIEHEPSDPKRVESMEHFLTGVIPQPKPINPEDEKLRHKVETMPAIAPKTNRKYWLRNGTSVTAGAFLENIQQWFGTSPDGSQFWWHPDGTSASGNRELDIVKDQSETEVIA